MGVYIRVKAYRIFKVCLVPFLSPFASHSQTPSLLIPPLDFFSFFNPFLRVLVLVSHHGSCLPASFPGLSVAFDWLLIPDADHSFHFHVLLLQIDAITSRQGLVGYKIQA